ncbi:RNA polymerase sigma-70 factor [Parabacteroides goldsteinii]|uniref:RNA polymerase sigma-70 factor n=1 Tax=Parabacteroides goldsteinii TaxID=328812 RepID=UPI00101DE9DB|nr:RNA polymerase sigma-70 factor [Parabacteroides goldsteinii]
MKEKEKEISSIDSLFWRIAIKDDEIAFRTLFFQFFSPLCVFAHRYIDNWDTCEDIVQETFFKIWKNRKNIEINTSSRNFLITSVKNTCIDFLRKQETEQNWQQKEIENNTPWYTSEDIYSTIELEQMLSAALAKLPDNIRIVFEKNRFEGMTYAEIAAEHNISVKTVEAYMTKALKHLRVELKDYLPLMILLLW